ncbi:MAG TPA: IclR family transcriptional regulator [Noviherbaspirillum sp.]|jgi:DNA-binding IclR family transcriptional regulator|uniref:IclR family transcriptional regulator n=1 Tax=Noviherbaspirillum sp. TaxID=1926288 RepID=UPI002F946C99
MTTTNTRKASAKKTPAKKTALRDVVAGGRTRDDSEGGIAVEDGAQQGGREKDRQYVTALARGLEVLRCFSPARPVLGTADIARMTGLPQPTAWRLCYTLLQEGYLVPAERDKLRLGIPVLSLGYAVLGSAPIADLAKPEMQRIALKYQGAVSLGVRDGRDMVYLQRCQGSSIILSELRVGSRVPLATSVTGWAYIAGLGAAEREALFDELASEREWDKLRPKVEQALADYDRTGYVINKGSLHPQVNAVAVPLKSDDGRVLLSLSSGGISQMFDDGRLQEVGAELRKLSADLVPALGAATL